MLIHSFQRLFELLAAHVSLYYFQQRYPQKSQIVRSPRDGYRGSKCSLAEMLEAHAFVHHSVFITQYTSLFIGTGAAPTYISESWFVFAAFRIYVRIDIQQPHLQELSVECNNMGSIAYQFVAAVNKYSLQLYALRLKSKDCYLRGYMHQEPLPKRLLLVGRMPWKMRMISRISSRGKRNWRSWLCLLMTRMFGAL